MNSLVNFYLFLLTSFALFLCKSNLACGITVSSEKCEVFYHKTNERISAVNRKTRKTSVFSFLVAPSRQLVKSQ